MEKFTYKTPEALRNAAEAVGYTLPWSEDLSVLASPLTIADSHVTMKNRLTIHPMEGFDSTLDGAPGELTIRRCD
ncbi:MAG: flavin oxidoreductase/NADH oxidase, partial [Clostridia bacterium]|nr:flavin oxidoreductase/NADH oxidase [Clostridia bacterium]